MGIRRFIREYPLVHLGVGLLGNTAFVIGSVLFLWSDTQTTGVWLFIFGSSGMLLGALGEAFVRYERHHGSSG